MRRFFSIALIGATLAAGSAVAAAQGNGQGQAQRAGRPGQRGQGDSTRVWQRDTTGRRMGRRGPEMAGRAALQGIQLTESQKASLKTIHKKYADQMRQLRQANQPAQGQQRQAPNADVRAKVKSIADNERAEIRAILTADQQKQFDANVAKLASRQGKGKGRRGAGR